MNNKRRSSRDRRLERGSILIIALVLAGLGTIGVAGWLTLVDARTHVAEASFTALERKVRLQNSRHVALEAMYEHYLYAEEGPSKAETYTLKKGSTQWGKATVEAFSTGTLASDSDIRYHKTGGRPFRAFSVDVDVTLEDGSTTQGWEFRMKSYNPILAGELLTIHHCEEDMEDKPVVTGNLRVNGAACFWNTDFQGTTSGMQANSFLIGNTSEPNLTFLNLSDTKTPPVNFPFVRQTIGYVGKTGEYGGELNVVDDSNNAFNSYFQTVAASGGYASISGDEFYAEGDGPDTRSSSWGDSWLLYYINNKYYSNTWVTYVLVASSPISSNVFEAALERKDNPLTESQVLELVDANNPIPDDIAEYIANADYTDLSQANKELVYEANGIYLISDGDGGVTVNLNVAFSENLLLDNVTSLTLQGQPDSSSADTMSAEAPIIIGVSNPDNVLLQQVTFEDYNRRPLILAIRNEDVLDDKNLKDSDGKKIKTSTYHTQFDFTGASAFVDWKLIGEFEGIACDFDASTVGAATIYGGLRTNHTVSVTGGTITLSPEYTYDDLEDITMRSAWIETYRQ